MVKELTLNKLAAALVAVAMMAGLAFAFAAERAHAITLAELVELFIALEVIPADKAEEARAVISTVSTTPVVGEPTMSCNFTRNLGIGMTGTDVMDLQKLLNLKGFTVAVSGAGSPGQESSYYGQLTAAAVAKMQEAFASEILTPLGLSAGTGYFGASTRAKANALCAAAPVTPPTVPTPPTEPTDPTVPTPPTTPGLSPNEASIEQFQVLGTPSDEEVYEGDVDQPVFGFEFDVREGDIVVNRLDVNFTREAGQSDPWRVFESVSLWADGVKVAEVDADRSGDWTRVVPGTHRIRFSGLDLPVFEGESPEMVVAVTVQGVIRTATGWTVSVPDNGLRARDGAGLDQYAPIPTTPTVVHGQRFDVSDITGSGQLRGRVDASNPRASVIRVDRNAVTRGVDVLVFELEARDAAMDVTGLKFDVFTNGVAYNKVVNSFVLRLGNKSYTARIVEGAGSTATTGVQIEFDLIDRNDLYRLSKDQKVKGTVSLNFQRQDGNYESGQQIRVSLNSASAEFTNGEAVTLGTQTAAGNIHELVAEGIYAQATAVRTPTVTVDDSGDVTRAVFEIVYEVTAFDGDFYIPKAAIEGLSTTTNVGTHFVVENAVGQIIPVGSTTVSAVITSTADESPNTTLLVPTATNYVVRDGETKSFTITVTMTDNGLEPVTRVRLGAIAFSEVDDDVVERLHLASPASDFRTTSVTW